MIAVLIFLLPHLRYQLSEQSHVRKNQVKELNKNEVLVLAIVHVLIIIYYEIVSLNKQNNACSVSIIYYSGLPYNYYLTLDCLIA